MSNLRRISKEDYYKIIKDWADINKRSPTKEDFNKDNNLPSPRTLEENIKIPWNIALKELGLEQIKDRSYYLLMDNAELLEEFKKEYLRVNPSSCVDFNKRRNKIFPESAYVSKRFGFTWNELLKECGFNTKNNRYTKKDFEEVLINLNNELKRTPSITDFLNAGYTLRSLLKSFNLESYNDVIKCLGLNINTTPKKCEYTNKELIRMYKDLCNKIGSIATVYDIDKCSYIPDSSVFLGRFTDIKTLRELAGVKGGRVRENKYSKEDIANILKDLCKKYNRTLTTAELQKEIKENKYPSIRTMQRHLKVNSVGALWDKIG